MRRHSLILLAVAVVALAGAAPAAAAVALRSDGVEYPDGSLQTTAAQAAGQPAQARVPALIPDLATCTPWTPLFSVPLGFELLIEWVSVEIRVTADLIVDVDLRTHDAVDSVEHALARLADAEVIALNPYASQRWSSAVALRSTEDQPAEFRACRNGETGDSVILVSFSGRLFGPAP